MCLYASRAFNFSTAPSQNDRPRESRATCQPAKSLTSNMCWPQLREPDYPTIRERNHTMEQLKRIVIRSSRSAVAWSWAMNGLRLASGLAILPLLIHHLSESDFGMYFIFLGIGALIPSLDFGFSVSIGRAVSYAMGGARELQAHSFAETKDATGPNLELLRKLLATTRRLYQWITLAAFLFLGLAGTLAVGFRVNETDNPTVTWIAWGITLAATLWEIYAGWWNVFLRSMDQVLESTRLAVLCMALKIILSCVLLLIGAGLLAVPAATLIASCLQRILSRRSVHRHLGGTTGHPKPGEVKEMVSTLWPNTWRLGIYFLGSYGNTQAYTVLCPLLFGLQAGATYSFTVQLLNIASSMGQVWTLVKWPAIGKLRVGNHHTAIQALLWPRVWLQLLTYGGLAACLVIAGPSVLAWVGSDKSLLTTPLFCILLVGGLCELNCSFWNTLIATGNRLPMVWPTLISNAISAAMVLTLTASTGFGMSAFVLVPVLVGAIYNYWKWPKEGAHSIGTTWWRFMARKF
jgi:O-antigen/teichoic acid export membrane protein